MENAQKYPKAWALKKVMGALNWLTYIMKMSAMEKDMTFKGREKQCEKVYRIKVMHSNWYSKVRVTPIESLGILKGASSYNKSIALEETNPETQG